MPARLRPTAPIAAEAILVGDPGRALMLAQALLEEPKMCNHARGLWGYTGRAGGRELTVQATGMGGPSAGLVLADLGELGVRRAVRVGTCSGVGASTEAGWLLVVAEARAASGNSIGEPVAPDPALTAALQRRLGDGEGTRTGAVLSLDSLPGPGQAEAAAGVAADMQTATLLERGRELGIAVAAVLIVTEAAGGERIEEAEEESAAKRAGAAAAEILSGSS